jgi:hypothetical protein
MVKKNTVGTARPDAVCGIPSAPCAVSQPGSKCETRASVSADRPRLQYVTTTDVYSMLHRQTSTVCYTDRRLHYVTPTDVYSMLHRQTSTVCYTDRRLQYVTPTDVYSILHREKNSQSSVTVIFWSAFPNSQITKGCKCF